MLTYHFAKKKIAGSVRLPVDLQLSPMLFVAAALSYDDFEALLNNKAAPKSKQKTSPKPPLTPTPQLSRPQGSRPKRQAATSTSSPSATSSFPDEEDVPTLSARPGVHWQERPSSPPQRAVPQEPPPALVGRPARPLPSTVDPEEEQRTLPEQREDRQQESASSAQHAPTEAQRAVQLNESPKQKAPPVLEAPAKPRAEHVKPPPSAADPEEEQQTLPEQREERQQGSASRAQHAPTEVQRAVEVNEAPKQKAPPVLEAPAKPRAERVKPPPSAADPEEEQQMLPEQREERQQGSASRAQHAPTEVQRAVELNEAPKQKAPPVLEAPAKPRAERVKPPPSAADPEEEQQMLPEQREERQQGSASRAQHAPTEVQRAVELNEAPKQKAPPVHEAPAKPRAERAKLLKPQVARSDPAQDESPKPSKPQLLRKAEEETKVQAPIPAALPALSRPVVPPEAAPEATPGGQEAKQQKDREAVLARLQQTMEFKKKRQVRKTPAEAAAERAATAKAAAKAALPSLQLISPPRRTSSPSEVDLANPRSWGLMDFDKFSAENPKVVPSMQQDSVSKLPPPPLVERPARLTPTQGDMDVPNNLDDAGTMIR